MTKETVRSFLGNFMNLDNVQDDDNIFSKGLVNSLFAMQLVAFLENQFDISITNDELDLKNFKDINSIHALVEAKIK